MIPLTAFLSRLPLAAKLAAAWALLCAPSVVNWMLAAEEGRRLAMVAAHGRAGAVIAALRTAGEANLYFSGGAVAGSMVLTAAMTWAAVKAEVGLVRALERLSSGDYGAPAALPGVYGPLTARAMEACRKALAASHARAEHAAAAAEAERQLRESARLEAEAERRSVMAALATGLAALAAARRGVELGPDPQATAAALLFSRGPTENPEELSAVARSRIQPAPPPTRALGGAFAAPDANRVPPQPEVGHEPLAAEVEDLRALLRRLGGERAGVRIGQTVAPTHAWAA